ncbi:MAG: HAD family hydrolase [Clostridia bacterium]|nr:HAD family hydrolase [Clostridia bacterium]
MRQIPIAALVYDYDHTLSPRDMQEYSFLPGLGVEPDDFWASCRVCAIENRMDGVLAYMFRMQQVAKGKMPLTRETLVRLGEDIEFFPGVTGWFERVNEIGRGLGVEVEHYIISSGLKEIIEGSRIAEYFKAVFATSFVYDATGQAVWPATAVNYTSKTQYLFRINKGILDVTNDRDLNAFTPEQDRRVPFTNMIYIGDGLTDVPCMKLTRLKGGYSIAVYAPGEHALADDMLRQKRADFVTEADYSRGSEIERVVDMMLRAIRARHDLAASHESQLHRADERNNKAFDGFTK